MSFDIVMLQKYYYLHFHRKCNFRWQSMSNLKIKSNVKWGKIVRCVMLENSNTNREISRISVTFHDNDYRSRNSTSSPFPNL